MPPEQPQQPNQNNYDFFMNPAPAPKRNPFNMGGGGNSQNQLVTKIIIGVVALIIILVGFTVVARVAGSGHRAQTKKLVGLTQEQQEIARISNAANNQLRNQDNRDFNSSLLLSVETDQHQLLLFLKSHGTKVKSKTLNAKHSSVTDQKLSDAQAASNYDEVYMAVAKKHLTKYERNLIAAASGTENKKEIKILKQSFNDAKVLLKDAKSH
jgi:hypothetical protein